MQQLRLSAGCGDCAAAQVSTLRERLLSLGVWVERSVRRISFSNKATVVHIKHNGKP
jgi:hypothetical protein